MNYQRRKFRPRNPRSGFRGRSNNHTSSSNGHFQTNGNVNRANGSMTNPLNVEKTIQKYLQLAKDALSLGDPVLNENYLQHAEHYKRRLTELNVKPKEHKVFTSSKPQAVTTITTDKKENIQNVE